MPGGESAPRLVLDDVVDALRRADAIVLAVEPLRLRHPEQALALHVAAHVQSARRRPDVRGEQRGKRRLARPGQAADRDEYRFRR
jgi:hypothetical protein